MTNDYKESNNQEIGGFEKVGYYIENGKLVPADPRTQERYSEFMRKEIAWGNRHSPTPK